MAARHTDDRTTWACQPDKKKTDWFIPFCLEFAKARFLATFDMLDKSSQHGAGFINKR